MCSSGAHYLEWEEMEEQERIFKEQQEGTDPKYICNYSGLPSLLIYQEKISYENNSRTLRPKD
jgi:hypothetical protein|tara:strand:+ start:72 stop:260 length:189 start_codon:yes stop_codon:yes gene_type:complete